MPREDAPSVMVRLDEQRLPVPLAQHTRIDQEDHVIGQFKQPDGVGDVAAAAPEPPCEVGPRDGEVV